MTRPVRVSTRALTLTLAALLLAAGPAAAAPRRPVGAVPQRIDGPVHVLVELAEQPAAAVYGTQVASRGAATAASASVAQLSRVQAEQAAFRQRVAAAKLADTHAVYGLQRVLNGVVYVTTRAGAAALKQLPGVKAVHAITPKTIENARGVPLVGVTQLWARAALPLRGDGLRIGVIDTGIDYTHANFGGPGTAAAYTGNDPSVVEASSFPTAKVVGGKDFAGATYDAGDPANATPVPDADPLDGDGHGSHVAGTIAGYGVTAAGAAYAGPWDATLDATTLRIGPGVAPAASLYALKVFGDKGGSTSLAYQAVEWAVDPNGDGNPADHLDVVNLSLGSSYGTSSDVEADIYTNAVAAGLAIVASAGNASDVYFISGAPGSTPSVISVAASKDGLGALQVNSPASIAGTKPAGTAAFGPAIPTPVTGDVVAADPANGCTALVNAAAVAGKIAHIVRGGCTFVEKAVSAQNAGAIAVVIANNAPGDPPDMGGTGSVTIPTRSVGQADGNAILAELKGGATVNVTLHDALVSPAAIDQIASFSSRGPTRLGGSLALKPDVAAPGQNVVSTDVGTGAGATAMSGTSMSAPLATGVVALLRQLHPTWTPAQIKALLMNTAGHDVFDKPEGDTTRRRVGPGRVGAGRVDAAAALSAPAIAYDAAAPERVSVTFQATDVDRALTETRTVRVQNTGAAAITFTPTLAVAVAAPGTAVAVPAADVVVPAGGAADVTLTLTADPAQMTRARDATVAATGVGVPMPRQWLSETSGWLVLTPQGMESGPALRVPYYAALTPASRMTSAARQLSTHGAPSGTASIHLAGTGVDTTGASAPPPAGVVSLVTPAELAWSSPLADVDTWNNAALRYVGVTSNYPDLGVIADDATETYSSIYFAISTYGVWGSHRELEFDVYVKRSGATAWEYVVYNTDLGASGSQPGTDVPVTAVIDLAAGTGGAEDLLNGMPASGLHLPAYLTDTVLLPVYAATLGLADGAAGIDFKVVAFSPQYPDPVDETPVLHYDLTRPAVAVGADPATGLHGQGVPPLWVDAPGATIPIAYDLTRQVNPASGVLLLHHHNAAGLRAEVLPVVKAQQLVTQSVIAVGSPACPLGGVHVASGFDDDADGVLDASEVTTATDLCTGAAGPQGPPGPRGKSGCSSVGAGSLLSLLGLGALLRRRRRR